MSRRMKWRRDGTSDTPKMIDLRLPGLDPRAGDRLQVPSGTIHRTAYDRRVGMIRECWALGGIWSDAVRALKARRIDVNALWDAKQTRGEPGIRSLLERCGSEPLAALVTDYLAQARAKDADKMRARLERFTGFLGDAPSVADLTTENVERFLATLKNNRCAERKDRPRPLASGATVNRYRAVIGGLSTWAIRAGRLQTHPIAGKKVEKRPEAHHRLPEMSSDEYRDYFAAVRASRPDLAILLLLLVHTGADVGEVLTRETRDVDFDRQQPRIRYQRTKTERFASSRPRFVPLPKAVVAELRAHIAEHDLRGSELLFSMFKRSDLETTHARAAKAIQRPELTLKDLRHIAAIAWVKAGVHIRVVSRYLGHSTLSQTMRYTDYEPDAETEAEAAERAAATLNQTADVVRIRPNAVDSLADSYAPSIQRPTADAAHAS